MSDKVTLTTTNGENFSAYLALPETGHGGGVVILQEIFGINSNIRSVADAFAEAGYAAIAPDLFWRQQPDVELDPTSEADRERATALMKGMDQALAVQDALIAVDFLRGLPASNGKVGAVGYCLGGKLAYLLASESAIDAAVSYYGVAIQSELDRMKRVRSPLLIHVAEKDHLCPPEAQSAIEAAASVNAEKISVLRHPDVGHAFARRASLAYVADAAATADAATFDLLAANLAGEK